MNLRDLKYLVALARHRHFGRAAEACFVSQPTLSTQLRKLEETLGVVLIERTSRSVLLTPIGKLIVNQARMVLREADQLEALAEQARDPFGGDFRLGLIPTVAPYLLARVLPALRSEYPNLRIHLTEAMTHVLADQLVTGDIDAVVVALPLALDHTVQRALYDEPFLLAVAADHPLAGRASIGQHELAGMELLLLEDGHCLRDQALAVCNRHGAAEHGGFRATSLETLRFMVAANIGVTLMPELAIDRELRRVRYVPFEGREVPHRRIGLCWRATSPREALLDRLAVSLAAARDGA